MKFQRVFISLLNILSLTYATPSSLVRPKTSSDLSLNDPGDIGFEPDYQGFSEDQKKKVRQGVADAYKMADTILKHPNNAAQDSYASSDFIDVMNLVFMNMVDENGKGKGRMEDVTIINGKDDEECKNKEGLLGRLAGGKTSKPNMFLCEVIFNAPPSLGQVKKDDLGNRVSGKMWVLGATILHELMHWDEIGKIDATGYHISDFGQGTDDFLLGYGCYNVRARLADNMKYRNADNYAWLGLQTFYHHRDGTDFDVCRLEDQKLPFCTVPKNKDQECYDEENKGGK